MLLFVVLFIAAIWVIRYPQNYVNMFIAHYDGTASVLESLKGLKRSDVERGSCCRTSRPLTTGRRPICGTRSL